MRTTKYIWLFIGCCGISLLILTQVVRADPPRRLNYQGRLADSNGVPVADGNYDMTFKIYDALTGGTLLWTEIHNGANQVAVSDGLFSTVLGAITGLPDFSGAAYYVEVTVGATTYSPRQQITGAATAVNSDLLDGYTSGNASGNIPISNGTLNTNLNADMVDSKHYADLQSDFDSRYVNVTGDTMTGNLNINNSSGRAQFNLYTVGDDANDLFFGSNGTSQRYSISSRALGEGYDLKIWRNNGGWSTMMTYDWATGYVGVATDPSVRLHVAGNAFFDTSGSTAVDRHVTIKSSGQGQLNFGAYPGNWSPALQIQNIDNTHNVWISALDNGNNARFRTGASGLDFYTGGTTTDTGTLAMSLSAAGNMYVGGDISAGSYSTLDGRYVNVTGDTMTGNLVMGSDGSGRTITFTAQDAASEGGEFYLNGAAANTDWTVDNYAGRVRMHTGGTSYFDLDTTKLSLTGGAIINQMGTAWGGWNESIRFPNTSHAALTYPTGGLLFGMHSNTNFYWANTTGGYYTMWLGNTGGLTVRSNYDIADSNTRMQEGAGNSVRVQTDSGYVEIGPQNTGWAHYITDRASHYFNTTVTANGNVNPYSDNASDLGTTSAKWRRLNLRGSPPDGYGALVPNYYQTKIGPGTGADNQWHTVLCDAGYAMVDFTVYTSNYADGDIRLTCGYLGDVLNTGAEGWYGDSGTCDNCWHTAQCPAGYVARGFQIYASGRLDTNMKLYCTQIATGNYTSTGWLVTGSTDGGDDDCYQGVMCPAGSYVYGLTVYATSYPDEDWMAGCRSPRP